MHHGAPVVQGELKAIKRSFGKKNVVIHADFDLDFLETIPGIVRQKKTTEGVSLQVESEDVAEVVFKEVASRGFVRKFELEEPSLHDIFIEKVGSSYE